MAANLYFNKQLSIEGPDETGAYDATLSDGRSIGIFATLADALHEGRAALGLDNNNESASDSFDEEN